MQPVVGNIFFNKELCFHDETACVFHLLTNEWHGNERQQDLKLTKRYAAPLARHQSV